MKRETKTFSFLLLTVIFIIIQFSLIAKTTDDSFSFIAMGDTRPDVYLPYNEKTEEELLPIVERAHLNWKHDIVYDQNDDLEKLVLTRGDTTQIIYYFKYYWPQNIVLYQKGKKSEQIYANEGNKWVSSNVAKEMNSGKYSFIVHTGDLVFYGLQGNTLLTSPYWQRVQKEFLNKLQEPDKTFPALGNHEYYQDPANIGFRQTFPWLKKQGFTEKNRIYSFIHKNSLFVFLDSGPLTKKRVGTVWLSKHPDFKGQMKFLKEKLEAALNNSKIKHVFVTYHFPSFCIYGCDALRKECNPHELLKQYSDKINIVVFNGHTHTTQQFYVDKINYIVLGDGGAPKTTQPARHPSTVAELFWRGENRQLMYNYICLYIEGGTIRGEFKCFYPPDRYKVKQAFYLDDKNNK